MAISCKCQPAELLHRAQAPLRRRVKDGRLSPVRQRVHVRARAHERLDHAELPVASRLVQWPHAVVSARLNVCSSGKQHGGDGGRAVLRRDVKRGGSVVKSKVRWRA